MEAYQEALFIHLRAEVEALVSEREGMRAANAQYPNDQPYQEAAFKKNADDLRCVISDPRLYA